jgi:hypothetical protein
MTAFSYASDWGSEYLWNRWNTSHPLMPKLESPLPPTILATLITSLHLRPFQTLPMLFPPVLLFSTYLNLNSFVIDSAGLTAAWSGLYILLAQRRKTMGRGIAGRFTNRFGARGLVRGAAIGLAGVNLVACGVTYAFGRRKEEDKTL